MFTGRKAGRPMPLGSTIFHTCTMLCYLSCLTHERNDSRHNVSGYLSLHGRKHPIPSTNPLFPGVPVLPYLSKVCEDLWNGTGKGGEIKAKQQKTETEKHTPENIPSPLSLTATHTCSKYSDHRKVISKLLHPAKRRKEEDLENFSGFPFVGNNRLFGVRF